MADVRCLPLTSHFHIFIAPSLDVHAFADIYFHSSLHSSFLYTGGGHYDDRGYGGGGGGYGGGGGGW